MRSVIVILFTTCLLTTGCTSLDLAHKQDVAQVRSTVSEELITINDDIQRIDGDIEEMGQEITRLSRNQEQQAAELTTVVKETQKKLTSDTKDQISTLTSKIQVIEKRQIAMQKEIDKKLNVVLEEVTRENKELRQQIGTLSKSIGFPTDEGYYVVNKGDSLSGIAALFGISTKSLILANDIKDANKIRPGQKLIIPQNQ